MLKTTTWIHGCIAIFHPSTTDKISTNSSWEIAGTGSVALRQMKPIHKKEPQVSKFFFIGFSSVFHQFLKINEYKSNLIFKLVPQNASIFKLLGFKGLLA